MPPMTSLQPPATAPLLTRQANDWLAHIGAPLRALPKQIGHISTADFLGHVVALASQLPEASHAINLCENRYLFLVSFCACLVRHQTSLLPANRSPGALASVSEQFAHSYVLHDGLQPSDSLPAQHQTFDISRIDLGDDKVTSVPLIDLEHIAAVVFTSGSTGNPKPIEKPWHTFVCSTRINAAQMLTDNQDLHYAVATVPGQHMWGMETSILMPLMHRICISDQRPFFPLDLCRSLAQFPCPRLLVTTPIHLRALLLSELELPPIAHIICATAPLTRTLAELAETKCQAILNEVYGCSEAGSLAVRRTAITSAWRLFPGFDLHRPSAANGHQAHWQLEADHLVQAVDLNDHIELHQDDGSMSQPTHFSLQGRSDDLIKVAGKRASLMELNGVLLRCHDVQDGVVFMPDATDSSIPRPSAIVILKTGAKKDSIARYFSTNLDPVFTPRPIFVTTALPRQENGKISRAELQALYLQLKEERR